MRVALVENIAGTPLGQVGRALAEAGVTVEMFRPHADARLPQGDGFDGYVVLGGMQSARDDESHPYLADLAQAMRGWAEAGDAVLGICLGAQLLARGFGAENHIGTAPEFGWVEIRQTPSGSADPLMAALPAAFSSFQWHSDTFDLPPGAVHLAKGASVPHQAFRIGARAYGTQFHFEADRDVVSGWLRDFPGDVAAMAPGWAETHAARAEAEGAEADAMGLALARAWVGLL